MKTVEKSEYNEDHFEKNWKLFGEFSVNYTTDCYKYLKETIETLWRKSKKMSEKFEDNR